MKTFPRVHSWSSVENFCAFEVESWLGGAFSVSLVLVEGTVYTWRILTRLEYCPTVGVLAVLHQNVTESWCVDCLRSATPSLALARNSYVCYSFLSLTNVSCGPGPRLREIERDPWPS